MFYVLLRFVRSFFLNAVHMTFDSSDVSDDDFALDDTAYASR